MASGNAGLAGRFWQQPTAGGTHPVFVELAGRVAQIFNRPYLEDPPLVRRFPYTISLFFLTVWKETCELMSSRYSDWRRWSNQSASREEQLRQK
jgi:hypothetical protein